jgi:hypothetical protein
MSSPKQQHELTWFLPDRPNDRRKTAVLSDDFRRKLCDPSYGSPLSRFLGNSEIVETLARAAFVALGRRNHCLSDQAFAFIGPNSSGKTTLGRLFAETVGLPLVEVSCPTLTSINEFMYTVAVVCERTSICRNLRDKTQAAFQNLSAAICFLLDNPSESALYLDRCLIEVMQVQNALVETGWLAYTLIPEEAHNATLETVPGKNFYDEFNDAMYVGAVARSSHYQPGLSGLYELVGRRVQHARLQQIVSSCNQAIKEINAIELCENLTLELAPKNDMADDKEFVLPPLIVLLDQIETLEKSLQREFLKGFGSPDAKLTMYQGDATWTIDTSKVCWLLTVSDMQKLYEPMLRRFTLLKMEPCTAGQLVEIVQEHFPKWSKETCQIAVRFGGKTPGDVLAFAQNMAIEKHYSQNADWTEAAKIVAQRDRVAGAKAS